jgi:hypothetical protein
VTESSGVVVSQKKREGYEPVLNKGKTFMFIIILQILRNRFIPSLIPVFEAIAQQLQFEAIVEHDLYNDTELAELR